MLTLNPYLNFNGNTEEAFEFYKSVFGGDFLVKQRFNEVPNGPTVPENAKNMIMHIALKVGNNILMGTDAPESMGFQVNSGNNFSLSLEVDNKEEAKKLFEKLSKNGTVEMPLDDTFWGAYFGMCSDKFGIKWMINHTYKK